MMESDERKQLDEASAFCPYCRWLGENTKKAQCPDHLKRLKLHEVIETIENRRVIERSKLQPPPPLPPRRR